MTEQQAWTVIAVLRAGAAAQELDDERLKLWHKHLAPLPYERTLAAARRWIVAPGADGRPKFLSSLDDVLTAVEVPAEARDLVSEAASSGGEAYPALEGWVCVPDGAPVPPGVEALRRIVAAHDAGAKRAALPAGPVVGAEQRASLLARLRGYAGALRGGSE